MNLINQELLNPFGFALSKPQYNHFQHYLSCLCATEKTSVQRFSALHNRNRSSLNRFLLNSPWPENRIKSIFQKEISKQVSPDSLLLVDDCLSRRPYAKHVEKANFHFDHTKGGQSLGYCLVTAVLQDQETTYPYDIRPFYRKCDMPKGKHITKNEIVKNIILSTRDNKNISCVVFDSWYSNKYVIGACREAEKHYITQIKSDRNVTLSNRRKQVQSHAKHIKEDDWSNLIHNNQSFRYFATSAFISGIGNVHLIFSQVYNYKEKKWGATHFIISDLLDIDSYEVIKAYLIRTKIEVFHREAKQNLGLEGYIFQKQRAIERHLLLLLIAYGLLILQNKGIKSIGEMCEGIKVSVFMQSFEQIQRNPEFKEVICKNLAKARV